MEKIDSFDLLTENGLLHMPNRLEVYELIGEKYITVAEEMWAAMWRSYLKNKGSVPGPLWANRFNNAVVYYKFLEYLDSEGWITANSVKARNWSEISIREDKLLEKTTETKLTAVRAQFKFAHFFLSDTESTKNEIARVRGKKKNIGIKREGFRKTGNTRFQFDTAKIEEYYEPILKESIKSMEKVLKKYPHIEVDDATYHEVCKTCLDYLVVHKGTYTPGQNNIDPRGRDIAGYLSKFFNPVAFKNARALLVIPHAYRNFATRKGLRAKYLFIAELCGFKEGTVQEKVDYGRDCYYKKHLANLDWDVEHDRKELHENIWLERTYDEIDRYLNLSMTAKFKMKKYQYDEDLVTFEEVKEAAEANPNKDYKWSVPLEIDMSASVLGYLGLLMNHEPFMERCNMLGDNLVDAWDIKGINTRDQAKSIMKSVYGSKQACQDDWKEQGLDFTQADVDAYNEALTNGEIALGARFRDLIIDGVKPKENMTLHVWNEHVETSCNKFSIVGEDLVIYDIYDSATKTPQEIHNYTTKKVPDLEQFRLYFVTALIHNLDSQVINKTSEFVMDEYGWCLDIHDALILCCEAADPAREVYAGVLELIHEDRLVILDNYFVSISLGNNSKAAWDECIRVTVPFKGKFKCNIMVLK